MAVLEELAVILGFRLEGEANLNRFSRGLDQVGDRITGLARNLTKFGAVAAGAFSAVGFGMMKLAGDAAKPLDALVKSADRAGVSFEALQRLGFAAEQSGSSTQEMGSALEMMSARLAEAARGSGRAKAVLDAYGISATTATGKVKDANVFFLELADHMETMDEAESLDLAQKLGLSRGLLTLLRSGRDAIEAQGDIADQAGLVFSEQNARDAERYNDTLALFTRSLNALKTAIGVDLLPAMTSVIERMQSWLNANREFLRSAIGDVIGRLSDHMTTLVNVMSRLEPGAMTVLAGAVALIASKWVRFAAFVVAVEDLATYLGGGESYFGSFVDFIRELTGVSDGTAENIAGIGAAIVALGLIKPGLVFKPLLLGIAKLGPAISIALGLALVAVKWSALGLILAGSFIKAFIGALATAIASAGLGAAIVAQFGAALAFLATPAGWAVILAGLAAALVAYFWDDLKALWNSVNWSELGTAIADGILNGLRSGAAAIRDFITSLVPDFMKIGSMQNAGGVAAGASAGTVIGRAFSDQSPSVAAQQIGGNTTTTQNNSISIEQTFNGATTTADSVRAGTRAGALDAIRSLGTTAPSPAQ